MDGQKPDSIDAAIESATTKSIKFCINAKRTGDDPILYRNRACLAKKECPYKDLKHAVKIGKEIYPSCSLFNPDYKK